jgi:Zn-dependent protease with chaperone function
LKGSIMKKLFCGLGIFLLMLGCATAPKVKVTKVEEDPASYRRLQGIGSKIFPVLDPERMTNYKIAIIEAETVNAFTTLPKYTDDGRPIFSIFFFRGVLNKMNDDQLTYIFSHEVSHCRLNHVENRYAASQGISAGFTVLGFIFPGAGYLNLLVNPLVTKAYSRSQEADADLLAVDTLKKIGLTSEPAISALNILDEIATAKGFSDKDRIGILDDHPSIEKRKRNILDMDESKVAPPKLSPVPKPGEKVDWHKMQGSPD